MNITAEEKLMYEVMKAIYESGIPINFKGSMVLKAFLMEAGYSEDTRHTVDIDGNWNSDTPPTDEQIAQSLQAALDKSGINLKVSNYRKHGDGRSAGFNLTDSFTDELLFTMDIDVNRPIPSTKIYEIEGISFCGVAPIQIIADKIAVVSSNKVFRRIKDVIDLYYLSGVFKFDYRAVKQTLRNSGRTLGDFDSFLHGTEDLKHSYEKFRFSGDVNKPPFETVYAKVKSYVKDVLPRAKNRDLER